MEARGAGFGFRARLRVFTLAFAVSRRSQRARQGEADPFKCIHDWTNEEENMEILEML